MLVFVFLIAFSLALAVLAAGLVVLGSQKGAWIKTAGFILAIGGALNLACVGYHGLKYYFTGAFEGSYSGTTCSMMDQGGMMGKGGTMGMMDQGMMGKDSTGPGMMADKKATMSKDQMMGGMTAKTSEDATGKDDSAGQTHESHHH